MFTNYGPYYEAARLNGLTALPAGGPSIFTAEIRVSGWMGGRPVFVERRIGRNPTAVFRAGLRPSLDLGLDLAPSGIVSTLATLAGRVDIEVGDAAFDDAFVVRGDEPERVKALLSPRLRAALMACAKSPLAIDDHELTLHYGAGIFGVADDLETINRSLKSLVSIGAEIDAARAAVPPAADVAPLVVQLAAYARERNLSCAFDTPSRVIGKVGELTLWITARRRKKNATDLEVMLQFEQPLDFDFGITTARTGFDAWLTGQDVQVGDAEIDRAFDIRTEQPQRLVALLDEGARRSLLDLGKGRVLQLDRTGLRLVDDARDLAPVALPALIERAADMLKTLSRATRVADIGAYR